MTGRSCLRTRYRAVCARQVTRERCCETAHVSFQKVSLGDRLTVIAGPNPPDEKGFCSSRVQVLHWRIDEPFSDPGSHLHRESDEVYVVLEGAIDLDIEGSVITVAAGEAVTVGAGVSHSLVFVHSPARGLTIRGPAVDDKVITG